MKLPRTRSFLLTLLLGLSLQAQAASQGLDYEALMGLPLAFIPNTGEVPAEFPFQATTLGGQAYFHPRGVQLVLQPTREQPLETVSMLFLGARRDVRIEGGAVGSGTLNFLRGRDRSAWRTGIRPRGSLRYLGVYDGIDLVYGGDQRRLKGTWHVAPGRSPDTIAWSYLGARSVEPAPDGSLLVHLAQRTIRETPPVAWQEVDGRRIPVACQYVVHAGGRVGFTTGSFDAGRELVIDPTIVWATLLGGSGTDVIYGLDTDNSGSVYITGYLHTTVQFPLLGGSGGQPFQVCYGGENGDAFVTKIRHNVSPPQLVYSTRLGGGRQQRCSFGSASCYVGGSTCEAQMVPALEDPTRTAGFDYSWYPDGLNPTEEALFFPYPEVSFPPTAGVANPSVRARGHDQGYGIAVDKNTGEVVVVGRTESDDFPGTGSANQKNLAVSQNLEMAPASSWPERTTQSFPAFQPLIGSNYQGSCVFYRCTNFVGELQYSHLNDAFVARLSADGQSLVFASYWGGLLEDLATDVAVDSAGNAYVTGWFEIDLGVLGFCPTQVVPGPVGDLNAFVIKVSPQGSLLGTFLIGGTGRDQGLGIDVGPASAAPGAPEKVYVTGTTRSRDLFTFTPTLAHNPLQGTYGGERDIAPFLVDDREVQFGDLFVVRLSTDLTTCEYLTYVDLPTVLGQRGPGSEWATGIRVDGSGDVYVTGIQGTGYLKGHGMLLKLRLADQGRKDLLAHALIDGEELVVPNDLDVNDEIVAVVGGVLTNEELPMLRTSNHIQGWFVRDAFNNNGNTSLRYYKGDVRANETSGRGLDAFLALFDKDELSVRACSYIGGEAPPGSSPIKISGETFFACRLYKTSVLCGGLVGKPTTTAPRLNALQATGLWNGNNGAITCSAGPLLHGFISSYDGHFFNTAGSSDMYLLKIGL